MTVCVHGLGYIGLPTAAVLADAGREVVGYDTDPEVREIVRGGDSHIEEPELADLVAEVRKSGNLEVADEVPAADYHLVCVPTPFDEETHEADLRYVESAAEGIGEVVRPGDAVILESTVPPGTTTGPFRERIEAASSSDAESGFEAGTDFSLAHCPETVLPGRMLAELRENDRLVGGVTESSAEAARQLYDSVVNGDIVTLSNPTAAEFAKLAQNTFRDVNIALANEMAKVADDYGVSSGDVIEAANTHPRVDILRPGPGVGGHCLPVDPWFLGHDSDRLDLAERARQINDGMPSYVADVLARKLGSLDGRKIAVFGVAYKGNVDDTRGSPGLALADELRSRGVEEVTIHDPHVSGSELALDSLVGATLKADAVAVTADHDEYAALSPGLVADRMVGDVIVDASDALDRERWQGVGTTVETL